MRFQIYEHVIGLEIHAQLLTKTKLFCGCSTQYGKSPNSLTCPVCLGLPGALPVLNREAVVMAIKLALTIKAKIHLRSIFSRKNYFYPDLPKGYQITQYHSPIATEGYLKINHNRILKTIGIGRINLEEDAGKSIHDGMVDSSEKTHLDFNRSGIPLLEIVGKPEINSPSEAVELLQLFRTILQIIEKNPKPLKQYLEGKIQVLGFFAGQVMKETRGTANPQLVNKILKEILDGYKN